MGSLKLTTILEKNNSFFEKDIDADQDEKITTNNQELKNLKTDVLDLKSDIKKLRDDLENLGDDVEDDIDRMSYVRQISGEFLEYLNTLDSELQGQVDTPESNELMNKIMGRSERKKYYMSKFRL
jgi:predicted RNase H-like nuclease (RuvC/YqgF family)